MSGWPWTFRLHCSHFCLLSALFAIFLHIPVILFLQRWEQVYRVSFTVFSGGRSGRHERGDDIKMNDSCPSFFSAFWFGGKPGGKLWAQVSTGVDLRLPTDWVHAEIINLDWFFSEDESLLVSSYATASWPLFLPHTEDRKIPTVDMFTAVTVWKSHVCKKQNKTI